MIETLLRRIGDAIQRHHDLVNELKGLSIELDDTVERLRSTTNRLEVRLEYVQEPSATVITMPQAQPEEIDFQIPSSLRTGPTRRGE
jgi:hypothetical protein